MTNKAKSKSRTPAAGAANSLTVVADDGKSKERMVAELGLSAVVGNTVTAIKFAAGNFGTLNLNDSISVMKSKVDKVAAGDLGDVEATLTAQAATLDAVFNELARRASLNMGEHLNATETYLRLALKAQAQCRATLETLAEVKYPKAATFVRQQNVAYQQQVNNSGDNATSTRAGAPAHERASNQSNELLEASHGERLDPGAKSTSTAVDSSMAAMGKIHRPTNTSRKRT